VKGAPDNAHIKTENGVQPMKVHKVVNSPPAMHPTGIKLVDKQEATAAQHRQSKNTARRVAVKTSPELESREIRPSRARVERSEDELLRYDLSQRPSKTGTFESSPKNDRIYHAVEFEWYNANGKASPSASSKPSKKQQALLKRQKPLEQVLSAPNTFTKPQAKNVSSVAEKKLQEESEGLTEGTESSPFVQTMQSSDNASPKAVLQFSPQTRSQWHDVKRSPEVFAGRRYTADHDRRYVEQEAAEEQRRHSACLSQLKEHVRAAQIKITAVQALSSPASQDIQKDNSSSTKHLSVPSLRSSDGKICKFHSSGTADMELNVAPTIDSYNSMERRYTAVAAAEFPQGRVSQSHSKIPDKIPNIQKEKDVGRRHSVSDLTSMIEAKQKRADSDPQSQGGARERPLAQTGRRSSVHGVDDGEHSLLQRWKRETQVRFSLDDPETGSPSKRVAFADLKRSETNQSTFVQESSELTMGHVESLNSDNMRQIFDSTTEAYKHRTEFSPQLSAHSIVDPIVEEGEQLASSKRAHRPSLLSFGSTESEYYEDSVGDHARASIIDLSPWRTTYNGDENADVQVIPSRARRSIHVRRSLLSASSYSPSECGGRSPTMTNSSTQASAKSIPEEEEEERESFCV
jgi:hypothetical protein